MIGKLAARKSVCVATAIAALQALSATSAQADVLLSNFESAGGGGVQGWFNYNGNLSLVSFATAPAGGTSTWMVIEFNNSAGDPPGQWATAGPTIQPWANSSFNDANFQAHNYLQFDLIFPSSSWLSNDVALPVGLQSNGGGEGIFTAVDTSVKDTVVHVAIDYSSYKTSNGGPGNITDWMNLLFGHPDETPWTTGGIPFMPRVYVDNVYLTLTSEAPAVPPMPNNGSWDVTKSGNWSDAANWVGGIPAHGAGNSATFGPSASPRSVNVNVIPITLGSIVFDSENGYSITGNGITLQSALAAPNLNSVTVNSGSHSFAAMTVEQSGTDTSTFNVASESQLTIDNLSGGGFGTYVKEGSGTLTVDKVQFVNLTVNGGTVNIKPGGGQANAFIFGLNVFNGSTFNLNGNSVRVNSVASNDVLGTINLGTGGVMNLGVYGGASFFGVIEGDGSLIVGAVEAIDPDATFQTVILGGSNTYSGSTTILNGNTLQVSASNNLGDDSATNTLIIDEASILQATGSFSSVRSVTIGAGGGTIDTNGNDISFGPVVGALVKNGLGVLGVERLDGPSATINAGVLRVMTGGTPNAQASKVQSLAIAEGASVDLTNNSLIIDYTGGPNPGLEAQVRTQLAAGTITTSAAGTPEFTRLGYADNAELGLSSFGGVSVDTDSLLIKFTYQGDADLDGDVDGIDVGLWAQNFTGELGGTGSSVWSDGDWDYDGDVDGIDVGLWAQAFTGELGGGGLSDVVVTWPGNPQAAALLQGLGVTLVPEPGLLGMLGLMVGSLLRPRRRA